MAKKRTYTLAQRRRDPKKRAGLSMSQLTPQQQAWRRQRLAKEKINRDPLYDPAQPLTGSRLKSTVDQLVDMEYAPQERAVKQRMSDVTTQGTALLDRARDTYEDIAAREQLSMQRQSALTGLLDQKLKDRAAEATAEFDRRNKAAATSSDVAGSPQAQASAGELEALRAREQSHASAAAAGASTQSANYEQLLNAMAQARQMQGAETQFLLGNRLANQQAEARSGLDDIASQRGAARAAKTLELRDQAFTNALAQQQLEIKNDDIQATLAGITSREKIAAANRTSQETRAAAGVTSREKIAADNRAAADARARADRASRERIARFRNSGAGAKEPAAARADRATIVNVADEIATLNSRTDVARLRGKKGKARRAAMVQIMRERAKRSGGALPDTYLSPALDLVFDKHISRKNRARLQALGINVDALVR